MRFSNFIWSLYRSSKKGRAITAKYEALLSGEGDLNAPDGLDPVEVVAANMVMAKARRRRIRSQREATAMYEDLLDSGVEVFFDGKKKPEAILGGEEGLQGWITTIQGLSLGLFTVHPEHFAPYFFRTRFHTFQALCSEFDIPMPVLPGKASWRERAMFYARANESLQEFRRMHGMTPAELCAFLYGFASDHVHQTQGDLPPPMKAWFIMGGVDGEEDFNFVDSAGEGSTTHWQGNIDTRRGDILVMWCVSPRSYVHSIWRAVSDGFIDPFFHYYSTVWVGSPCKTPTVSFKELSADPVWRQKPAVRAHFQGASGKAVSVEEYDALLAIFKRNGFDIKKLPRIEAPSIPDEIDVQSERDVEESLLEPLLKELGYAERDWVRNMPVRMGRGERFYPDYALGAQSKRGDESARMIVEAKHRISTMKQLTDAYYQAKSYASRLQSAIFVLVAAEGIWIYQSHDGAFSQDRCVQKSWGELAHPDTLHEVALLIGKRSRLWSK